MFFGNLFYDVMFYTTPIILVIIYAICARYYRKAKKQIVELRLLYVENRIMKIWHVQKDMNTTVTNYVNLKNDWLD